MNHLKLLLCILVLPLSNCDNPVVIPPAELAYEGTGVFIYSGYEALADKPIKVYYHIPETPSPYTPILLVFHGSDRNGAGFRDAWISKANQYGFMVFAPEFSEAFFPGGDAYNLGNVFEDGDNPSAASLNDESVWTFSVVEPLFDFVRKAMANQGSSYELYGHSAGAQFVHRLVMHKPDGRFGKVVVSAAGWYTVPDVAIDFPYGIGESPVAGYDLRDCFARKTLVLVGEQDNDPNAPALRRNSTVDQQGTNRLARAQHFFQRGQEIAGDLGTGFNWEFQSLAGVGHQYRETSKEAADWLFD